MIDLGDRFLVLSELIARGQGSDISLTQRVVRADDNDEVLVIRGKSMRVASGPKLLKFLTSMWEKRTQRV